MVVMLQCRIAQPAQALPFYTKKKHFDAVNVYAHVGLFCQGSDEDNSLKNNVSPIMQAAPTHKSFTFSRFSRLSNNTA